MKEIRIGDHVIGDAHPPFFVAELGICHGGSVDTALELVKAAVDAGAHCIKTETFQSKSIVFHPSAVTSYSIKGKKHTKPLAEVMDRFQLTYDEHKKVKEYCDELRVPFLATAHDFEAIDMLKEVGAAAIKIASPDVVHYPLLRYAASKGLPVCLDVGASYQYEIEIAVKTFRDQGFGNFYLNHSPSGHPAPASTHDLRMIPRMKELFDIPIGIADHFEGYEMSYAAIAVGANAVEKPISFDRFVEEPEINWSVSVDDLQSFIKTLGDVYDSLGNPERTTFSQGTVDYRYNNRMSCVAAKNLAVGSTIDFNNVTFGRPRMGIGVENWDLIEGRTLKVEKQEGEFINWEDL